ncbi:MAG: sugar transferase [Faecalimonas sp.]
MSKTQVFKKKTCGIYEKCIKRFLDFTLSLIALILLSPILLVFTVIGIIKMKGNPFFYQERPGKNEKIFKLIKFRTMTNKKDKQGKLLPDEQRLTSYGSFLRSTSIDELPELVNILKGDMSIIGPRPLLVKYLPLYNEYQKHRHDVRPGLTGYAQVVEIPYHGKKNLIWMSNMCSIIYKFVEDVKIFLNRQFLKY